MISRAMMVLWCGLAIVGCTSTGGATDEVEQALTSDLTISPGAADFGAVVQDTTSSVITFTVTNHGAVKTGALTRVLAGPDAAEFTLTSGCGAKLAPGASCTFGVKFKPTAAGVATASVTVSGSPGGDATASLSGTGVAPAALAISPAAHDFGATLVGSTSAAASFTVSNVGGSATGVPTVTVPAAYSIAGTTCVAPLAPGATCAVMVTFTPGGAGNHNGNLKVKANPGSTVTAALSGTGLAPGALAITPSTFDFGTAVVGSTSATGTFTVRNTGGVATGIPSIALDGTNAAAFTIVTNGCTAALAPNATCAIGVRFAPAVAGQQGATLAVSATHGGNAVASLAGTGIAPATLAITPSAADFGSVLVGNASAPLVFSISNTGGATSGIPAIAVTGGGAASFTLASNTCVGPLPAGATCTVAVRFAPIAAGATAATLGVSASPGGSVNAALAGTGVAPGQLSISPSSQDFGSVVVGQSSGDATFTVTNVGGSVTGPLATALTGTDATAFMLASSCSAVVLAPGASCTASVRFSPISAGAKSASLLVSATPGGSVTAALAGNAIAPATLAIAPASRDFGTIVVGSSSAPATFTVSNTGGQVSGIPTVDVTGADATSFPIVANNCAVLLAPGASCTIVAQFAPAGAGPRGATLTVAATPGGTVAAAMSGTGVTPGQLAISPSAADFGTVPVGQISGSLTFTVQNLGGSSTGAQDVTITGTDAASFVYTTNCAGSLPPGATCTIIASFAPASAGAKTASLSVSATPGGTATAALSGTGISPATLAIAPGAVDFGTVIAGSSGAPFTFTVSNTGGTTSGVPTTSLAGSDPASFAIVSNTCTGPLPAGATCNISVQFAPTTAGSHTATLQVGASPGGTVAAALSGNAVAPSALAITPSNVDFGSVAVGSSSSFTFTVTNTGGAASGVASTAVTGTGASAFAITSNSCEGVVLAPGASCTVSVRFSPVVAGPTSASLTVSATPGGTASAALAGTGIAPAQLQIAPGIVDFGSVVVGSSSSFTFTVTNTGGTVSGAATTAVTGSGASAFALTSNSCEGVALAPGASCTVSARFSPVSAGPTSASLTVSATPGGAASAALSGTGVVPAQLAIHPSAVDFGSVVVGSSSSFTFTVSNDGSAASGVASTAVTGSGASAFTIAANSCEGSVLAPGASCIVSMRFSPVSAGSTSASLTVSATPGGAATAALSGTGIAPATLVIAPSAVDFGSVVVGSSHSFTFTVTNTGGTVSGAASTAVTGSGASAFAITSNSCDGSTLAPGGSCNVSVRFAPASTGPASASLTVSASPGSTASAGLSGSGI